MLLISTSQTLAYLILSTDLTLLPLSYFLRSFLTSSTSLQERNSPFLHVLLLSVNIPLPHRLLYTSVYAYISFLSSVLPFSIFANLFYISTRLQIHFPSYKFTFNPFNSTSQTSVKGYTTSPTAVSPLTAFFTSLAYKNANQFILMSSTLTSALPALLTLAHLNESHR